MTFKKKNTLNDFDFELEVLLWYASGKLLPVTYNLLLAPNRGRAVQRSQMTRQTPSTVQYCISGCFAKTKIRFYQFGNVNLIV